MAAGGPAGKTRSTRARHGHRPAGAVAHGRRLYAPGCEQGGGERRNKRAAVVGRHTPIMTSDALMTAHASSPALRLRSATASFVIADVMTIPLPMSMRI